MTKNKGLGLTAAAALVALGLGTVGPAQAIDFGDMMNPGKWFGGKNRNDAPPYGYDEGYGPPPGYYGQPGMPPAGYGGGPYGGPGGYGGGPYGGPGGYGAGPYGGGPAGYGAAPYGGAPAYGLSPGYGGVPGGPAGGGYSAPAAPAATPDPAQERIRELEQRIDQLERQQQRPQSGYGTPGGYGPMR